MRKTLLSQILSSSPPGSWAHWVASDEGQPAKETRELLDTWVLGLPESKQSRVLDRFKKNETNAENIEALIHEIVTNELLHRFNLASEFDPTVNKLTPDIAFYIANQKFISDVFVTHSPQRTVRCYRDGTGEADDNGDRARKIGDTLVEKAHKYANTKLPLVIFLYLGDHILSGRDVEKALFGLTIGEIEPGERFQDTCGARKFGGVFLSIADGGLPRYPNLSAVVVCDWFDTLNRSKPGKRLHCLVLHHYSPDVPLPPGALGPFPEVTWQPRSSMHWAPHITGQPNIVARFAAERQLEFGIYTSDAPW